MGSHHGADPPGASAVGTALPVGSLTSAQWQPVLDLGPPNRRENRFLLCSANKSVEIHYGSCTKLTRSSPDLCLEFPSSKYLYGFNLCSNVTSRGHPLTLSFKITSHVDIRAHALWHSPSLNFFCLYFSLTSYRFIYSPCLLLLNVSSSVFSIRHEHREPCLTQSKCSVNADGMNLMNFCYFTHSKTSISLRNLQSGDTLWSWLTDTPKKLTERSETY